MVVYEDPSAAKAAIDWFNGKASSPVNNSLNYLFSDAFYFHFTGHCFCGVN